MANFTDYLSTWKEIEQSPEYKQASYEKQREAYNTLISNAVQQSDDFAGMPRETQRTALETLNDYWKPGFVDPQVEATTLSLLEQAEQGDEAAREQIDAALGHDNLQRKSLIYRTASRVLDAMTGGNFNPLGREVDPALEQQSPDQEKALSYLRERRQISPQWRNAERIDQAVGMGFELAEIMGMTISGAGASYQNARGLGAIAARATEGAAKRAALRASSVAGASLRYRAIQGANHAVVTGMLGTMRELTIDALNNELPKNKNFREMTIEGLKTFGTYVAFDIAANMIFDVFGPMVLSQGKIFAGYGKNNKQAMNVINELLDGKMLSDTVLQTMDGPTREMALAYRRAAITGKNVADAAGIDLMNYVAATRRAGVDYTPEGSIKVIYHDPKGRFASKTFKEMPEAEEFLATEILRWKPEVGDAARAGRLRNTRVSVEENIRVELPDLDPNDRRVLANVIAPRGGKFAPEQVEDFTRQALKASNADEDTLINLAVRQINDNIEVRIPGREPVQIPVNLGNKSEVPHIRRLVKEIDNATSLRPVQRGQKIFTSKDYRRAIVDQELFTPEWAKLKASELNMALSETPDGGIRVLTATGESHQFANTRSFTEFLVRQDMTPEWVEGYLKKTSQFKLAIDENGVFQLKRGSKVVSGGHETIGDLVEANPRLFDKIPDTLAPKYVLVDDAVRAELSPTMFRGSFDSSMRLLDKFTNARSNITTITDVAGNRIELDRGLTGASRFKVHFDDMNYTSPEMTLPQAKKLLQDANDDLVVMREIALDKGYKLDMRAGQYVIYDGEGRQFVAKNIDELKQVLKESPTPAYAPELLMSPDALHKSMPDMPEKWKIPEHNLKDFNYAAPDGDYAGLLKQSYRAMKGAKGFMLDEWIRPPQAFIEQVTKRGADGFFAKHLNQLDTATNAMNASEQKVTAALIDIFGPYTGGKNSILSKGRKAYQRRTTAWYDYLTMRDKAQVIKTYEMDADEIRRLEQVRDLLGRSPDSGLFKYFGVDPDKFLVDYLPALKKAIDANPKKFQSLTHGELEAFWKAAYGGAKPPKELDAFFMHHRNAADVTSLALERDPLALLHKYNMTGHRKAFLGGIWSEYDKVVKTLPQDRANQAANFRMQRYRMDMMGIMTGPMAEGVMRGTTEFLEAMGHSNKDARKLVRGLFGVPYLATMGLRVWLPIRNSFQIYTTLAPRYGNHKVTKAVKKLLDDDTGNIVRSLRESGVIDTRLPTGIGFSAGEHPVMRQALAWYKSSDEFTRAVAYTTATDNFDDALRALQKGDINWDSFMNTHSGYSMLYENQQQQVFKLLQAGHYEAAKHSIGDSMVKQTMFNYRAGNTGIGSTTLLGKLFGSFGTYPINYTENLVKGFKSAKGLAAKATWAGTFLGNSYALYTVFNKIMGVNANNFLPWTPMVFTGGPLYDLMNEGLAALGYFGGDTYSGRSALAQFAGVSKGDDGRMEWKPWKSSILRLSFPGYYFFNSMGKAAKAFERGDVYEGIMNLGSFPLNKDYFARSGGQFDPDWDAIGFPFE